MGRVLKIAGGDGRQEALLREPAEECGRDVVLDGGVLRQRAQRGDSGRVGPSAHGPAFAEAVEVFLRGQAVLLNDRGRIRKVRVEDLGRVFLKVGNAVVTAERGGSADTGEALPEIEEAPQTPDETGEVRALSTVERMQLVDHEIAQRVRGRGLPEAPVLVAQEQVVEHLVVREQDVGRILPQNLAVRDADVVAAVVAHAA